MIKHTKENHTYLDDLLQYHQNLDQRDVTPLLMAEVAQGKKTRVAILLSFFVFAIMIAGFILSTLLPHNFFIELFTQQAAAMSYILVLCCMLPSLWLLSIEK